MLTILSNSSPILANQQNLAFQQQEPKFVVNSDYRQIETNILDSASDLTQLQQVADIEIFYWYGSTSCQRVEQALDEYLQANPGLIVRRTPLAAHLEWRQQAYLQPMMEQLEQLIDLPGVEDIYQACIDDCSVFNTFESAKDWLGTMTSVSELPLLNEAQIWQAEKSYRKRAESYSITQVPTIIIRESYAIDANSAKSVARLIEIIDYLLTEATNL